MWKFAIDVGGTFTDVVSWSPEGQCHRSKVLSSGKVKCSELSIKKNCFKANNLKQPELFLNYEAECFDAQGARCLVTKVTSCSDKGLELMQEIPSNVQMIELNGGEPSPVLGIRQILNLKLTERIPVCELRLGTTRGTNALLERKGAKCVWVTTKGFADQLKIGDQTRPELFKLDQPQVIQLPQKIIEIEERLDAKGQVLKSLDLKKVHQQLSKLQSEDFDSIAITFLHSYLNPVHEKLVRDVALELGFSQVSASVDLCCHQHFLDRSRTTVLDAYLSPVIKSYLHSIQKLLPGSKVLVMDSAGGLKTPEKFSGKDSILSGPAGGVVAIDAIAKNDNTGAMIGFDMGGTSTDVCRWDGRVELEKRSEKAEITIVTPSLSIETVAAGGGSICHFDGQRLRVGPESAGSDPGPACYGKGGPLSVTDLNVWLGRVHAEHFPFKLNHKSIESALKAIDVEMQSKGMSFGSLDLLAENFLKLANFTMAQAIRRVSSRKGFAPQDHTLVCFGGAGAQHAAELAEILKMDQVLIHPLAGVLSAWGISKAQQSEHQSSSCFYSLTQEGVNSFEDFKNSQLQSMVKPWLDQGFEEDQLTCQIEAEIRSKGMDSGFFVDWKADISKLKQDYLEHHKKCFGYAPNDELLYLVSIRLEVAVQQVDKEWQDQIPPPVEAQPEMNLQVLRREDLDAGQQGNGPLLIVETCSSTYIPRNWKYKLGLDGSLRLTRTAKQGTLYFNTSKDALGLEIFTQQFTQIASQMGTILQKTSRSVNVKERLDFSCAILDDEGNLVVNAPHIPVHLGAMGEMIKSLKKSMDTFEPGDVYLANDPYLGGSHLPDLTVMTPVFDPSGKDLRLFVATRAHHSELGGLKPGSCYPFASNLAEEGVVFRHFKIGERGTFLETELMQKLTSGPYPSRNPGENCEDIKAAMAANHQGTKLLNAWIEDQGWVVVQAYMKHLREMSRKETEAWIATLTQQEVSFSDVFDDGTKLCINLKVKDKKLQVDFTGSSKVHEYSLNATPAIVKSAILYSVRCLMGRELPLNQGVLEALEIYTPKSCFLNPIAHDDVSKCSAVVAGNVEVSQKIVDVFLAAMGAQAASQGTMNNVIFGNDHFGYYETISGGMGATSNSSGASGWHSHMTNTRMTDVEIFEDRYPVRLLRYELRKNSGGDGDFRGGEGVIREIEFLEDLELNLLTQRRATVPFGLNGAEAGKPGENILKVHDQVTKLAGDHSQFVESGSVLLIKTPGGGGFNLV